MSKPERSEDTKLLTLKTEVRTQATECAQPPEAGKGKEQSPLEPTQGIQFSETHCRLLISRTVK